MAVDVTDCSSLNGVSGWLIWPVANFALVISGCLFLLVKHSSRVEIAVIIAVVAYCAVTLIFTMKHAKVARYMFMTFYALAFVATNLELVTLPSPGHMRDVQLLTIAFRSAIEMGLSCTLFFPQEYGKPS